MGHPWEIFLRLLPISWSWLFANFKALGLSRHGAVVVVARILAENSRMEVFAVPIHQHRAWILGIKRR